MAKLVLTNEVVVRDKFGRFISECDAAATRTLDRALEVGERVAKAQAPVGKKPDPRTTKLKHSIRSVKFSSRSGGVVAAARHALAQEFGAGPHPIDGNPGLAFFWEREGRMFRGPHVDHPGNPANPYLRPAYVAMMARVLEIAAEEYPS